MPAPSTSLFDLSSEVGVVLGGTGVLGSALATGLASAGARIAVVGRNKAAGLKCAGAIQEAGGQATFFEIPLVDRENLASVHRKIEAHFGAPTVLVNAIGGNDPSVTVSAERPFNSITEEAWRASFDLNLTDAVLLPCQEFGSAMAARARGAIINIGSVSAHLPLSRVVAYSAAKAALLNLTQFLAREWAPMGVRVNSITPGFFPAEQNRNLLYHPDGTPTPRAQSILNHTPMARFGKSEELIGAAIFLASSHASSFVTGIDLRVDGGFLAQTI